jgi:hypothetical protein
MSSHKKQAPGLYIRINGETQKAEERPNRALRKANLARARHSNLAYNYECKANRLHQTVKASRIYSKW